MNGLLFGLGIIVGSILGIVTLLLNYKVSGILHIKGTDNLLPNCMFLELNDQLDNIKQCNLVVFKVKNDDTHE